MESVMTGKAGWVLERRQLFLYLRGGLFDFDWKKEWHVGGALGTWPLIQEGKHIDERLQTIYKVLQPLRKISFCPNH